MEERGRTSKRLRQKCDRGRNKQRGETKMAEKLNGNNDVPDKMTEIRKGRKD